MQRRRYLAALGAGVASGLAGCSGIRPPGAGDAPETTSGTDLPIPRSELTRGAPKNAIPAIVDPVFADDWSSVKYSLSPEDRVIGVAREGEARAYPLAVLDWHEVVNDAFAGPLLVTFCPLCGSGVTAKRRVNGEVTRFGVSGLLWKSDLVMYDETTGSLWSQIRGQAIRGPETGERLSLVPSSLTTLREWRRGHPETEVLLPPPKSDTIVRATPRNYGEDPYAVYGDSDRVGIGANDDVDDRLHPKTMVVGIAHGGVARAYPLPVVEREAVIEDEVGGLPVVVTVDGGGSLAAYVRRVDDRTLQFRAGSDRYLRAGGSRWERSTGRAIDGPLEGRRLERANDRSPMFWFAWAEFHPDTGVYGDATTTDGDE